MLHSEFDEVLIISDNVYFSIGLSNLLTNSKVVVVDHTAEIPEKYPKTTVVIIYVSDASTRETLFSRLVTHVEKIVVVDKMLSAGGSFKICNVVYVPLCIPMSSLDKIITGFHLLKPLHLTSKENQYFQLSFLNNNVISKIMLSSVKTCSAYRNSIKAKCSIKRGNAISMERLRREMILIRASNVKDEMNHENTERYSKSAFIL